MAYENVPSALEIYDRDNKTSSDSLHWSIGAFIMLKILDGELTTTGSVTDESVERLRQTLACVPDDTTVAVFTHQMSSRGL